MMEAFPRRDDEVRLSADSDSPALPEECVDDDGMVMTNPIAKASAVVGGVGLLLGVASCGMFQNDLWFLGLLANSLAAIGMGIYGKSRSKQLNGLGCGSAEKGIVFGSIALTVVAVVGLATMTQRRPGGMGSVRSSNINNMKQVSLAHQNYDDCNGFLTASTYSPPGVQHPPGRGLSWRVGLLPYMEQDPTYRQFDPLGTWDSPENLSAGSNRIALYLNVHDSNTLDTRLQVFTGLGTLFETDFPLRIASTPDGVSNTILFTESATLIPWASPRDLAYNRWQTIPSLGHPSVNYVLVTMADGSVRSVKKSINPAPLHALIQRNDGVAIPPNAFD